MSRRLGVLSALLLAVVFFSCGLENVALEGAWKNQTGQLLLIAGDFSGRLTQTPTCTPELKVDLERDPWGGWAIRFHPDQRISYPLRQKQFFTGDSFCSSEGSKPMCNFCRVTGTTMTCESTHQDIVGSGVSVTHDCNWTRVTLTASTSTVNPACTAAELDVRCHRDTP
ncbi:MAG: hypothetical protein U1E65_06400 [Myxococcota bacterium]